MKATFKEVQEAAYELHDKLADIKSLEDLENLRKLNAAEKNKNPRRLGLSKVPSPQGEYYHVEILDQRYGSIVILCLYQDHARVYLKTETLVDNYQNLPKVYSGSGRFRDFKKGDLIDKVKQELLRVSKL